MGLDQGGTVGQLVRGGLKMAGWTVEGNRGPVLR